MRPAILNPLFAEVTDLKGVGPRLGKLFQKLCGPHVVDLLWHLPVDLVDRSFRPKVADAPDGRIATLTITVEQHQKPHNPRQPYRVRCRDASGTLFLVFFHVKGDWLERQLPIGASRIVSGKVEHFNNQTQMTHPDYILDPAGLDTMKLIEPVYRLTAGLTLRIVHKAIEAALARAPQLDEWSDTELIKRRGWPTWRAAITAAHAPARPEDLLPNHPVRERLAYDELLANQLTIALLRARTRKRAGRSIAAKGELRERVERALPFALTGAQRRALGEIAADMAQPLRMNRLLQGDVGSGKTVVALLAMCDAVEAGGQAVLMAPTEILARQHFATLTTLTKDSGITVALLTGREKGRVRAEFLERLAAGEIQIAVGTHALFQDEVAFKDLALAVIDEQHRFGVEQRVQLAAKGKAVDILVMTATPIPRTLEMTAYGDLDSSRLDEKPANRAKTTTSAVPLERLDEVLAAIRRALAKRAKIYWICPLIDESEDSDLQAAEARFSELFQTFGNRVGLVHGRMKGLERDRTMAAFASGGIDLLVATTVIEVGVDVTDATIMVIEHAERFGLAQLHQLRGRIGRGDQPASCLLLYASPLSETAKQRLTILRESDDGFRIAEEDLRLRGAGEVLGTRQSGFEQFRLADLAAHADLIPIAREEARLALARDAELDGPRGAALRTLLYLFARDAAVRYLRAG
ncbi:MAG TPA: ATP-dependent DNA helicase RecG [Stellaceae bacterium]|nr:ATP-dependent DNA helicase RecG [Stellaceae bacterium]